MSQPFLRIPPFPGHRAAPLALPCPGKVLDSSTTRSLVAALGRERVGSSFWGAQPAWPDGRDLLLAPSTRRQAEQMLDAARSERLHDRCVLIAPDRASVTAFNKELPAFAESLDPWHLTARARRIWVGADHELALVAALARRPVRLWGKGRFTCGDCDESALVEMVRRQLGGWSYTCPFTQTPLAPVEVVELLSDWRKLIDRNRQTTSVFGIAAWKRPMVDPLLWDGSARTRHRRQLPESGEAAIVWKSRTPATTLAKLETMKRPIAEIEDGMIRGQGLGANCVPPLSVVVDFSGIYFDPTGPSDLERILESSDIAEASVERASRLRQRIVEAGISKYAGGTTPGRLSRTGRQLLVIGQVEDDRSIISGGSGQTNIELLQRTRSLEPDAWLIYRPHPDVEAGHRKGHVPDEIALCYANEIDRGGSISSLIDAVDGVHCITSLAGFEALLRGKDVTTHGVPFYAGWGLTRDLAAIPGRRTRCRSLDELVAATLILYPRYVDPVTRLPCPPEVVVERMARGEGRVAAPLSGVRTLQGKMKLALRRIWQAAA